jgi:hypothetical protein
MKATWLNEDDKRSRRILVFKLLKEIAEFYFYFWGKRNELPSA